MGFFIDDYKKKTSFEFEVYNNLIVIPVMLGGKVPLRFILDTGVSTAILFERTFTDMLNVDYTRTLTLMGLGRQKAVEAYVATDLEIHLPGLRGYRQSLLVLAEDYLELSKQLGTDVHGIIGYDVFRKFVVEINYDSKTLTFYDQEHFKPRRRWTSFPIEVLSTKPYMQFPVWMNDSTRVDGNFLLDTGASHAILINDDSDERLAVPERRLKASLGKGLTGEISGYLARIEKVEIGKFAFDEVIASFPDDESYSDSLMNIQRSGTLGGEILSRFTVVFDYLEGMVYLKKGVAYRKDFEYNMSGMEVTADGPGYLTLRVSQVKEDSPSDSVGIKKGDLILAVNGLSGESLSISNFYKIMNSREGRKIRIRLLRDGEKHKKVFVLKRVI